MITEPERWGPVLPEDGFEDIRPQKARSWRKLLIHIEFSYSFPGGLPGLGPRTLRTPLAWTFGPWGGPPLSPRMLFALGGIFHISYL